MDSGVSQHVPHRQLDAPLVGLRDYLDADDRVSSEGVEVAVDAHSLELKSKKGVSGISGITKAGSGILDGKKKHLQFAPNLLEDLFGFVCRGVMHLFLFLDLLGG